MSRHRGAKPCRRCGLLGKISLLSPEYLLSVERRPFHSGPPITRACCRTCSARPPRSQAGLHSGALGTVADRPEPTFARLRYLLGGDRPSQTTRPARSAALARRRVSRRERRGSIPRYLLKLAPRFHCLPPILYARRANGQCRCRRFTGSFRPSAGNSHLHE